jgi:hypothetical protein
MTRTKSQILSPVGVLTAIGVNISGVSTLGVTTATNVTVQQLNVSGISTLGNVSIGAGNTTLIVRGDVRITGILTVGTASITFDGNNNRINVGSGITFNGSTGIISATEFRGNGANLTGISAGFVSGTLMLFQQTSAPTGWTKQSTHNNKSLRVVTGNASSGGTSTFTSVFASRTPAGSVSVSGSNSGGSVTGSVSGSNSGGSVNNTTLSTSQIPSHRHNVDVITSDPGGSLPGGAPDYPLSYGNDGNYNSNLSHPINTTGSGGSHGHGFNNPSWSGSWSQSTFTNPSWSGSGSFSGTAMDFAVQYVDLIIAAKD